jgi:ribonuclease PH
MALEETLGYMILGQMHPCTKIQVVVQMIEDDGSVLPYSFLSA